MSEVLEWVEVLAVAGFLAFLVMSFITVRMHVPTGSMIPSIDPRDSFFVDRISYYFRVPNPGDIVVFWHTDAVLVRSVDDDTTAAAAIEVGDRISAINREPVYSADAIDEAIAGMPDGTRVYLGVQGAGTIDIGVKTAAVDSIDAFGIRLRENRIRYVKRLIATEGQTVQIRNGDVFVDGVRLDGDRFDRYYSSTDARMAFGIAPTIVPEGHWFVLGDNSNNSWDSRYWGFVDARDFIGEPYFRVWPLDRFGAMNGYFGSS